MEEQKNKYVAKTTIMKALKQLEKKHGIIRPTDLVQFAEPIDSPLHSLFEWSDLKAASEYRLWQARQLITSVHITIQNRKLPAYQNVVVKTSEGRKQGYFSTETILSETDMRKQLIQTCREDATYFFKKWALIEGIGGLEEKVNEFFDKLLGKEDVKFSRKPIKRERERTLEASLMN